MESDTTAVETPATVLLTAVVLGLFSLGRLPVDLLPQLIYPQIGVRIIDPAVPANIMEDRITRQIEEQLAITEDASGIESETSEGISEIELYFDYGKDIDIALRDASTRLDRAKRILPTTIDPPIIFKRDPSQIPVLEFVVSSPLRDMTQLRTWTDDVFAKQFLNVAGVAAVEVGGGLVREVHVLPDQRRLAALGLSVDALIGAIERGNADQPAGRVQAGAQEFSSRTAGRLRSVEAIAALPIALPGGGSAPLGELAEVVDTHEEERIRVRYNGTPGVRLSIQKQPSANTVEVADGVSARLAELLERRVVPEDVRIDVVSDQSVYVRRSLQNAALAAASGAALAMTIVYLFLGSVRGTLIIGSAIPISILITFALMALGGLSLNLMTLGGLALGIGMLVDNTIVMLENIERHRREGEDPVRAAESAAGEVTSAIVAATSTNLAAVVPFLFVSGLIGLLFRELIFTIAASIVASLVVAVTLVPTLAARGAPARPSALARAVQAAVARAQAFYARLLAPLLRHAGKVAAAALALLALFAALFAELAGRQAFLPTMDDGRVLVRVVTDTGTSLQEMDRTVARLERMARAQDDVPNARRLAQGTLRVTGDLTINGVTKPVTLNVTYNKGGKHLSGKYMIDGFSATGSLKRSDFGMKAFIPWCTGVAGVRVPRRLYVSRTSSRIGSKMTRPKDVAASSESPWTTRRVSLPSGDDANRSLRSMSKNVRTAPVSGSSRSMTPSR